jgi:hypothetical protein
MLGAGWMAEIMNQNDVRRLSSFIYECFLTRALGVDPALNLLSEQSGGSVSSCFLSCELCEVGLLPMWMMILSRAPLMILVFDP